jgi:RNA polymerase sigma factor (sigma-70 family)
MTETQQLLSEYAANHSDEAFRALVNRFVDLVYATAMRLVQGDTHLAEDVVQTVFLDLSRTAKSLPGDVQIGGWLHRHTFFVASKLMRGKRRRDIHEREAAHLSAIEDHTKSNLAKVAPFLDEAIEKLGIEDRTAISLRFFEQLDLRTVGEALGSNEAAAQKRVSRALRKLYRLMKRRGCTLSLAAIGSILTATATPAAPIGLAVATTAAILSGTAAAAVTTTTAKVIAMTTVQKLAIVTALTIAVGTGIYEARRASNLGVELQVALERQEPLAAEIQQLKLQRSDSTNRLVSMADQLAQAQNNSVELMKLRAEVARLRRDSTELASLRGSAHKNETDLSVEESLLKRIRMLKERLAATPEAQIPELQYLDQNDWLMAARREKLETDDDYRLAFADLRQSGEQGFLRIAEKALQKYLDANRDQFPTEISQLKPFFAAAPDEAVLQRFQIVQRISLPAADVTGDAGDWLITPKNPSGSAIQYLGKSGVAGSDNSPAMAILAPAMKAMLDAAPTINGKKQADIHQLGPYLTTPEQKAAYETLIQGSN